MKVSVAIALKDLGSMLRERTFVSVILLLIFVASFASVLTFGLLILYNPTYLNILFENELKIGVAGDAPILQSFFDGKHYASLNDAFYDFYAGKIDVILWLPKENLTKGSNYVKIFLPRDEVKSIQASIILKKKLLEYQDYLRKLRGMPAGGKLFVYSASGEELIIPNGISMVFKFIYVVLIPLMMITTAVIASGLFIDLITEEKETGTIDLLLAACKKDEIVSGKILAAILLPVILTPLWLLLLMLNGVEIHNFFLVLSIAYSFSFLMISVSAFIVTFFKDRERSQLVFSLVTIGIIPVLFIHPLTPSSLISRLAAGTEFGIEVVPLYFALGILLLFVSKKMVRI
ncbi:MAG: ABC transporter permease [Archaeoglobus sp.]|nr:ABC transporter permease [Archaeoglobus sp.]